MGISLGLRRTTAAMGPALASAPVDETGHALTFEALYEAAFPRVYGFIRCQVSTPEAAQEVVSRAFLKACRNWRKAPPGDAAMQWVFRIAHNTLIDYWRVDKRRERASLPIDELCELPAGTSSPEETYERKRQLSDLLQVVGDLADEDRTLLALKFGAHRTNRDIALILNVSEGAVSMRLLRSLRRLRERLESMGWR